MSDDPHFELPHEVVGSEWEKGLAAARKLLGSYVASEAAGALRLRQSQAVSAGFVDGELHLIWRSSAAPVASGERRFCGWRAPPHLVARCVIDEFISPPIDFIRKLAPMACMQGRPVYVSAFADGAVLHCRWSLS